MAAEARQASGRRFRIRCTAAGVGIVVAVFLAYAGSLFAYSFSRSLGPPDLEARSDTVVVIRLDGLQTIDNKLDVKVLVVPADALMDKRFDVLSTDIAVRIYPWSDLEELRYPRGRTPGEVPTTLVAKGEAEKWPFDTYRTDTISADVLVGSGDNRETLPARVEVTGHIHGWDIKSTRSGRSSGSSGKGDDATVTLVRSRGALAFDLGICLVMLTLPAMALYVAIGTIRGRKKPEAPVITWFAVMVFAIVPLRSVLPGTPPAGAWIDQAVVLWVLIALVAALLIYVVAWYRQPDPGLPVHDRDP